MRLPTFCRHFLSRVQVNRIEEEDIAETEQLRLQKQMLTEISQAFI